MQSFATCLSIILVPVVFGALTACSDAASSDGEGPKGASGVASNRSIDSLSADERSALCEWSLETQGGAGKIVECGPTESKEVHTKERCLDEMELIASLASCTTVTIAEVEQCSIEEGEDACGESPSCDALNERLDKCADR